MDSSKSYYRKITLPKDIIKYQNKGLNYKELKKKLGLTWKSFLRYGLLKILEMDCHLSTLLIDLMLQNLMFETFVIRFDFLSFS